MAQGLKEISGLRKGLAHVADSNHKVNMANLFLTATHLNEVIEAYEATIPKNKECSNRFRKAKFENINGKAMSLALDKLNETMKEAVPVLKSISQELRAYHSNDALPPKKTLAAIHLVIVAIVSASKELPDVGRIWRWNPDYHAYRHAMEPMDLSGMGSKVDTMYEYLARVLEVAE